MTIEALTRFFMWCTVINGSLLFLWGMVFMLAPNAIYKLHSKWFPSNPEQHAQAMYLFLGLFKLLFLIFNLTPYVALRIIS